MRGNWRAEFKRFSDEEGLRFKSVQTVAATLNCRYNDATEYTADASLPTTVDPARTFVVSNFWVNFDDTDNGIIDYKFELLSDGTAVRWTYVGNKSQNGSADCSVAANCTVYELRRPLRSKQFVTTQGASVSLAAAVDTTRAMVFAQCGQSGGSRTKFFDVYFVDTSNLYVANGDETLSYPRACVIELP